MTAEQRLCAPKVLHQVLWMRFLMCRFTPIQALSGQESPGLIPRMRDEMAQHTGGFSDVIVFACWLMSASKKSLSGPELLE